MVAHELGHWANNDIIKSIVQDLLRVYLMFIGFSFSFQHTDMPRDFGFGEVDSNIIPDYDNTHDLGSSSKQWKDIYIHGVGYIDSISADTAAISDLTSGRVVLAGTSGELEDSGNLTFDGSTLTITGSIDLSADIDVDGTTNLDVLDVDVYEHNEAFASASCAVAKEVGIPNDRFNLHGGAVSLGHPLGSSGTRCLITMLGVMRRVDAKSGIVTLCLGGGNAVAMLVKMD